MEEKELRIKVKGKPSIEEAIRGLAIVKAFFLNLQDSVAFVQDAASRDMLQREAQGFIDRMEPIEDFFVRTWTNPTPPAPSGRDERSGG